MTNFVTKLTNPLNPKEIFVNLKIQDFSECNLLLRKGGEKINKKLVWVLGQKSYFMILGSIT